MKQDRYLTSPCMGICKLFEDTNICQGCFRTLQEITDWSELSETGKLEVLNRIEQRKQFYLEYYNEASQPK